MIRPACRDRSPSTAPRWLRLTRTGDTITGYDSSNGTNWHRIGSAQLAGLPMTVYVGLFATSPTTSEGSATQATASFDHIAIGPTADGAGSSGTGVMARHEHRHRSAGLLHDARERRLPTAGDSIIVTGSGDIAPAVATVGGDTASDSLLFGLVVALIVLIVIGTMFITSEYRRGLIRTTFAATPDRGRVLAAKAVVIGGVAFAVGAVAVCRRDPARRARHERQRQLHLPGRSADARAGHRRQRRAGRR